MTVSRLTESERERHVSSVDGAASPTPHPGHRVILGTEQPLRLDCGAELPAFTTAYQT